MQFFKPITIILAAILAASTLIDGVSAADLHSSGLAAKAYVGQDGNKGEKQQNREKKKNKKNKKKSKKSKNQAAGKNKKNKAPSGSQPTTPTPGPAAPQPTIPATAEAPEGGAPPAPPTPANPAPCCVCYGQPTLSEGGERANEECADIDWKNKCPEDRIINCTVRLIDNELTYDCYKKGDSQVTSGEEFPKLNPACSELVAVAVGDKNPTKTYQCVQALVDWRDRQETSLSQCAFLGECEAEDPTDKKYLCALLTAWEKQKKGSGEPELKVIFAKGAPAIIQNQENSSAQCFDASDAKDGYYTVTLEENGATVVLCSKNACGQPQKLEDFCAAKKVEVKVHIPKPPQTCKYCGPWKDALRNAGVPFTEVYGGLKPGEGFPTTEIFVDGVSKDRFTGNQRANGAQKLKSKLQEYAE